MTAGSYLWIYHAHTCLEKLSELVTWNVSFMQNKTEHLAKIGSESTAEFWNGLKLTDQNDRSALHWLKSDKLKKEKQIVEVGTVVLGLATSHAVNENDSRYVELIRLHITTNWQCLRWAVTVSRALPLCLKKKFEVLHLFRCSTHAPQQRGCQLRPGQWDEDENEGRWRWDENENEMKAT